MSKQTLQFTVSAEIPGTLEQIYNAWLNGDEHAAMTGVPATGSAIVGCAFTAYGDYITGKNEELVPFSKIVQSWRSTEFEDDDEDSTIEVTFEEKGGNTLVTLTHSHLPPHGVQYEEGWKEHYFEPMIAYFSTIN
jgi:uncharacterized protein YndB with AHSA1/START domain